MYIVFIKCLCAVSIYIFSSVKVHKQPYLFIIQLNSKGQEFFYFLSVYFLLLDFTQILRISNFVFNRQAIPS